jgi:hypothetical protein
VTGLLPVQAPAWQVYVRKHWFVPAQLVPLAAGGLLQLPVAGLQVPAA